MGYNYDHKIPLAQLLAVLKANNYDVSIERILEIQSALLSTDIPATRLSELKFLLAPILAKTDEEQKNIYNIIDHYIEDISRSTGDTRNVNRNKKRNLAFALKVLTFVAIVATAISIYFIQRQQTTAKPATNQPNLARPTEANTPAEISQPVRPPTQAPGRVAPAQATISYGGTPIKPTRLNVILQMAAAFGLGLGGILYYLIFFERKNRMEAGKKLRGTQDDYSATKEEQKGGGVQNVHAAIQFPARNFLIRKSKEFSAIRTNLKKSTATGKTSLHVIESVTATARNAGFPSLVFDNLVTEKKFLVLIEQQHSSAHINQLFNYLVSFLIQSRINVTRYYFGRDINELWNDRSETISLRDLPQDFPDHELIIISNGHFLFENDTHRLKNETGFILQSWPSKSIITPMPVPDWSSREKMLTDHGLALYPAEISGIEMFTRNITGETSASAARLARRIRQPYSVSKHSFNTAVEIREYLNNEDLFQVICSLAVYPKLNWNLTIALFDAIVKGTHPNDNSPKPDYDTLLKISRIPHLDNDQFDDSIRLQLLNLIKPAIEITARETINKLLHEINPFVQRRTPAYQELQVQLAVNSFFLYAHDPHKYKQYEDVKNEFLAHWKDLDDWALKQRVNSGLMPLTAQGEHQTVEEFVLQEKQFEKRNVTLLRLALLILPAAILYILLTLFRPPIAYLNSFERVSFPAIIKKNGDCNISRVIVRKLDKFDTTSLQTINGIDYVQINNTEYDRVVEVDFQFADQTELTVPIEAKDSTVTVNIPCPQ